MIPYYSSHIGLGKLKSLFKKAPVDEIVSYFQRISGKKYVLLTSSCRSALYLTYNFLKSESIVAVSPLTCAAAIEPIFWAGKKPFFLDIQEKDLLPNHENLIEGLNNGVRVIQLINLGGKKTILDPAFIESAVNTNTFVVEDCAQSLSAFDEDNRVSVNVDVKCYSLMKTGFGIGGGVLATDNEDLFISAKEEQSRFPDFSKKVVAYRIVRNIIETYRINLPVYKVRSLRDNTTFHKNDTENLIEWNKCKHLKKPSQVFFKIFGNQMPKLKKFHEKRNFLANLLINNLIESGCMLNYSKEAFLLPEVCSKLFIYHPKIQSQIAIRYLKDMKIDAKHLEHREDSRVQCRFDTLFGSSSNGLDKCSNYLKIHDHLISIPLHEDMKEKEINLITESLRELIHG